MIPVETLTVVGVGLIGGSVGLAAKTRGAARRVVGVGRDERNLARAAAVGAIDTFTSDLSVGVATADLVVVCTPVDRVGADVLAAAAAAPPRAVITDAGSTKGNIVRELAGKLPADRPTFVGSHPLAGSEKKGAAHSRADLFDDRLVIVTPTAETDLEAVSLVELFWQKLGARVVRMDPFEHDRALAVTSHLPHAAASGLAGVTPPAWLGLTAGGFRDCTRIASGDPQLWAAIFEANRDAVTAALDKFTDRMAGLRQALTAGDTAGVIQWLTEAKQVRDALGS
ncbi:prephenate dehydrogenase [Fimbriiglobus ruber]|uniref:Prephenate and/or arogenate dehydrogenase n=1 Tax=Fimbriiglobus ruber TaxID=1908690 RepID=A0A225E2T9_9BACT|nr:prephenate dehydrogenase/arogenate dehydrogenase family protein [Fimbriiglobus ruber]OWK44396.1 Prephenate and/or arogenate dehydrogenase [Fimbriiglobus ruber]